MELRWISSFINLNLKLFFGWFLKEKAIYYPKRSEATFFISNLKRKNGHTFYVEFFFYADFMGCLSRFIYGISFPNRLRII